MGIGGETLPDRPPIGRDTTLCMSLAGRPGHFGSRFHNRLYALLGLDYIYKAFSTNDLAGAIGGIRALGIRGCAVSMPFKEAVIPLLDVLDPSARAIDSVNTIVNDGGTLSGFNTDYLAIRTLLARHRIASGTRFLLRGSGGMAKAVVAALRDAGFRDGTIVARNAGAGPALAARYGFAWTADLEARTAPLLINVTPMGMEGPDADVLAFPEAAIASCAIALDVVALPSETPFLTAARRSGALCISGHDVVVLQGLEQFIRYTGVTPSPAQVADAAAYART
ncbi:shikimate 5-dehydrogenase [Methylobacterium sp. J-068]|uniref:shikimate 5-dehydrogenase n=1 Tax=Methylobacterium sp. J-068 TaxID=2836649 RepID=UPI001FB95647|nr:shikimate 5-dehydrogenase [Methylobacterium sp. J-068]MCJ2037341.1 shikimate 5-dehydrogenase [Methylobacterium sp. J-068]